ncbi:MAG: hypothetical protein PHG65_11545 [Kiritimatiellae bacterium]|nr:hypothetical protein [Kiritimatiellia bacterium]
MNGLTALCFSKDRPLQLDGYLRSVHRWFAHPPEITVLYTSTDSEIRDGYEELKREHPEVHFLPEQDFALQVLQWLDAVQTPLVLFGCDDVVYYQPVNVNVAGQVLREHPDVLGFSLRLGLNICHTHTRDDPIPPPAFITQEPILRWRWANAASDWGYPFELNGTLYRVERVRSILHLLEKLRQGDSRVEWRHPNFLESSANHLLRFAAQVPQELAAFPRSCLVVPTINQVQTIAWNHIMGEHRSVRELETLRRNGTRMNLDAYAATSFNRIHVGEFFITQQSVGL